jgi:hypothetical protein
MLGLSRRLLPDLLWFILAQNEIPRKMGAYVKQNLIKYDVVGLRPAGGQG